MGHKIVSVLIEIMFPKSHIQVFLSICSQFIFESKLAPRPQLHTRMFYPFYYKDVFVRDCIIELKERNSIHAAKLFGEILSRWIIREIYSILEKNDSYKIKNEKLIFYLVPVPQHISKTKEKGFCHTTSLTKSIYTILRKKYPSIHILLNPCIVKDKKTKKLHDTAGKNRRFKMIKNTMKSYITERDAEHGYFFIIDDVYTTGATFKEVRRSLSDCAVPDEHISYVSIAH